MTTVVGYVANGSTSPGADGQRPLSLKLLDQLRRSLSDHHGSLEEQAYRVEARFSAGSLPRMDANIDDLLAIGSDLKIIVTMDARAMRLLARKGFPRDDGPAIVAAQTHAPWNRWVNSVARFDSAGDKNATGVLMPTYGMTFARFELMKEALPHIRRVGVLRYTGQSDPSEATQEGREIDAALAGLCRLFPDAPDVSTDWLDVSVGEPEQGFRVAWRSAEESPLAQGKEDTDATTIAAALASVSPGAIDVLMVQLNSSFNLHMKTVLEGVRRGGWPDIHGDKEFVTRGGFMSYGRDRYEMASLAGLQAARILGGKAARELPLEPLTRLELALNEDRARELEVVVPQKILAYATDLYGEP